MSLLKRHPGLDKSTAAVLSRAHKRVPARDANEEMDRLRAAQRAAHDLVVSFEVVVARPGASPRDFAYLRDEILPRLTYHLHSKRIKAPAAAGAFLSLFVDLDLYFIEGQAFYEAMRDELGWSPAQLTEHLTRWREAL